MALEDELQRMRQRVAATERAQYGNSGPAYAGAPVAKTPLSAAMARFGIGSLSKQSPSASNPSLVSGAQRISPLDKINALPIDGGGMEPVKEGVNDGSDGPKGEKSSCSMFLRHQITTRSLR